LIEKAPEGKCWGRAEFEDDLLAECDHSLEVPQNENEKIIIGFPSVHPLEISFQPVYEKVL
jgi:hypothetical protein